ncbi:gp53-like domain-containing protein [Citrobacter meridianamericanus]
MSKIARYQGNVRAFASDAQGMERTVFGGTNQADDLTSQITASFLRGWGIVGASEHPSLEDFNAAMYAMSQFIAYQHQMGVPEWHAEQEYHLGSICTHNGESYQSLQNANVGSQPPSAKWTPVLTSKNGLANLQLGEAAKSGVVQTTGKSEKDVISQKGATESFALKTLLDNFGGATLLFNKSRDYSLQLSDAGALSLYSQALDKIVMAWSPSGELLTGTVGFEHVKELKSAAKKDVGNGAGQIPDMSFFPLSGMGTDNLIAKLPNGLIIQVFRRTVSNSSTVGVPVVTSATYPTPFPSGLWGVFATKSTYAQVSISCESATSTGFDIATVLNTGTGGSTLSSAYFIALGY